MAAPVAVGPYSPALRAGEWVILSGQLGLADGKLVDGGVPAQVRQIFANARNILNEPQILQRYSGSSAAYAKNYQQEEFGVQIAVGVKSSF